MTRGQAERQVAPARGREVIFIECQLSTGPGGDSLAPLPVVGPMAL